MKIMELNKLTIKFLKIKVILVNFKFIIIFNLIEFKIN